MSFFKHTKISLDSNIDTVLGCESYFQGTLTAKGSLRIDGRVDGAIVDAKAVAVGKTGKMKGDISAEVVIVSGEVKGNITAIEHIEVLSESRVEGDLKASKITLEEGAVFNGNCSMSARDEAKTAPERVRK
ncbi:MAG: polymer-forming cytoskeletal protein [Elusimicrobia bacterium]|nr:polymer-forming cytoskeletal protein [Elusimicrobiota bacterium]